MIAVRGWCPSAHRPMQSGDGYLVRVRPRMARLSGSEAIRLCDLAEQYGNGMIDLTTRGNLQVRGVAEADHPALLAGLIDGGLVDGKPSRELPLTVTPFADADGLRERVVEAIGRVADRLPPLPDKIGIVVDTGPIRLLAKTSGDFRVERGGGGLILRLDGADKGRAVTPDALSEALVEMAEWFVASDGGDSGRVRRHLHHVELPEAWKSAPPVTAEDPLSIDPKQGCVGVAFGQMTSGDLRLCLSATRADTMIVTPWRMVILTDASGKPIDISERITDISGDGATVKLPPSFITDVSDPISQISACPGAPRCAQATVDTRDLARRIAPLVGGDVHVSGCTKGCARQTPATITIVGRDGKYDLVCNGRPGDAPEETGHSQRDLIARISGTDAKLAEGPMPQVCKDEAERPKRPSKSAAGR